MKLKHNVTSVVIFSVLSIVLMSWTGSVSLLSAQDIVVNSADPPSAAQGTLNLNVTIKGKGFKRGALAKFIVTGTTDPGGIRVNSTTFKGPTELVANIDVADNATVANFDIEVQNADGRIGKGIELFSVTAKGQTCQTSPLPAGFTLLTKLNTDLPSFRGEFGRGIRVAQVVLDPNTNQQALVVAVGSRVSGTIEVFVLDLTTGQVVVGHPHVTLLPPGISSTVNVVQGDANGDSVPDILVGSNQVEAAYLFLGQLQGGMLSYSEPIPLVPPAGEDKTSFGQGLAVGDIDGLVGNEALVGAPRANVGGVKAAGKVFVFKFAAPAEFVFDRIVTRPKPKANDDFGRRLAVADVTGSPAPDLIVGAPGADAGNVHNAGIVFVFPGPISSNLAPVELARAVSNEELGYRVAAGDVHGDSVADVITVANLDPPAVVFKGLVATGQSPDIILGLDPALGTVQGYGTDINVGDINGDGLADVLVGAPNAGGCTGAAYVYLSGPAGPISERFILQPGPPFETDPLLFGWAVAAVPGTRLFLVGEPRRKLGDVGLAGQVYVFRRD